jgi:hypothetical protein
MCVGVAISSAEYLTIRRDFRQEGVFAWRILSSRPEIVRLRHMRSVVDLLGSYKVFVALNWLRLGCCFALPFLLSTRTVALPLLAALALSSVVFLARNIVGCDGSDQMGLVVLVGLTVYLLTSDTFIQRVALLFIAGQALLSYTVAGGAKLLSPKWRQGSALREIMNTRTYGAVSLAVRIERLPRTAQVLLSWSIIGLETGFAIVLFLPWPWCFAVLGCGLLFHLATALSMGLNTFMWSFAATYPSVLFLHDLIRP